MTATVHPNSGRASLPALRRAPPERCGGRPLVQVTHDAGTSAALSTALPLTSFPLFILILQSNITSLLNH
jgi:hypothetical protein